MVTHFNILDILHKSILIFRIKVYFCVNLNLYN